MSATVATTTNKMPTFMKSMANLAKDSQVSNAAIKAKKAAKAKGAKEYAKAQKAAAKEEKKIDHYSKKDLGLTPEMKTNNLIPFLTPYTSCYYSIGMFILSLLCKMENIENITHNMNSCELLQYLKKYENLKLYHTLLYCLHEDPYERKFIVF